MNHDHDAFATTDANVEAMARTMFRVLIGGDSDAAFELMEKQWPGSADVYRGYAKSILDGYRDRIRSERGPQTMTTEANETTSLKESAFTSLCRHYMKLRDLEHVDFRFTGENWELSVEDWQREQGEGPAAGATPEEALLNAFGAYVSRKRSMFEEARTEADKLKAAYYDAMDAHKEALREGR